MLSKKYLQLDDCEDRQNDWTMVKNDGCDVNFRIRVTLRMLWQAWRRKTSNVKRLNRTGKRQVRTKNTTWEPNIAERRTIQTLGTPKMKTARIKTKSSAWMRFSTWGEHGWDFTWTDSRFFSPSSTARQEHGCSPQALSWECDWWKPSEPAGSVLLRVDDCFSSP